MLKYDEGFDDNQTLFLDNLVENCKIEKKQLFEMPPPQPIVEAPVIPIPFYPKIAKNTFFSEHTNKETFTIDEARTVIQGFRTVNNGCTEKSYYDKVNAIMTKFNLNRNLFRTLLYIYEKNAKTESNC
jgi:hypothetical protein